MQSEGRLAALFYPSPRPISDEYDEKHVLEDGPDVLGERPALLQSGREGDELRAVLLGTGAVGVLFCGGRHG